MTPTEVKELAFAHLGEFATSVGYTSDAVFYSRISARQRELFTWASNINPEFYGENAIAILQSSAADLNDLEEHEEIYPIESIQVVRIHDPGTSGYAVGLRIRIVNSADTRDIPPRMVLRSKVLTGVGDDLSDVASIRVWYSRRPRPIGLDGTGVIELDEPSNSLLALDLAKYILRRDSALADRAANLIATMSADEDKALANFEAHIRATYRALESRFG